MLSISYASLCLRPPYDKERLLLVRSTDAIRLCRDGAYQAVPSYLALAELHHLGRWEAALARDFVAAARLSSFALGEVDDPSLLALLRTKVRLGELVAIRETEYGGGGGGSEDRNARQRRLVREIGAASRHRLSFAGSRYRLVTDVGFGLLRDRSGYEVVSHQDAVAVLQGLAEQGGPKWAKLLAEASGMLASNWRPPFGPDGLVLLRVRVRLAPTSIPEPAMTPSQIRKLLEEKKEEIIDWTLWIELDPDDPKAQDDTVILLDAGYEEVERVQLSGCPKSGSGVLVIFKQVDKHSRYTLIRDYGPDEGGGQDTLFIGRSPAELEEECKKSS